MRPLELSGALAYVDGHTVLCLLSSKRRKAALLLLDIQFSHSGSGYFSWAWLGRFRLATARRSASMAHLAFLAI